MSAEAKDKPGVKCVAYRNTGTYGTPTWTPLTCIKDANVAKPWDLSEASVRATRVKLYAPAQVDFAVSITVKCDNVDTGYKALNAKTVDATVLDMLILDGPLTDEGAEGVRAHWHVSDTGQDQSIGVGATYKTLDLKPGFSTEGWPMAVAVGAASAITMTAPGA
jgi:hypothetical protein